jgi:PAS domain S-box-containing protein
MTASKKKTCLSRLDKYRAEVRTKDRLLSSILKISGLLNRPINSEKILQQLVREMKRAFALERGVIFLINKKEGTLEVSYVVGFSPKEVERAFRHPLIMDKHLCRETLVAKTGKTIYIRNAQKSSIITQFDFKMDRIWNRISSISMPLKIKGEIIGVIQGDRTTEELVLSKGDVKLFSSFASQASIIIENARLHEQAHKKIEQLMLLNSVSEKTSSTLNINKLADIIAANALKIAHGEISVLYLVDRDRKHLRIASLKGYEGLDTERFRLKFGENVTGWVAEKGVPLLVNDVSEEPRYSDIVPGVASMVAVPLISENNVLGVLSVNSDRKSAFSLDDLEWMMILARHAAALINNLRLYERVTEESNFTANILERSPNSIVAIDENKKITSINRRTEEILKLRRKNILGKKIGDVFGEAISDTLTKAIDNQTAFENEEINWTRSDGENLVLQINSTLLRGKDRAVQGTIVSIQDLTEIKKTEELIHRMDKLSSLGQLSAGLAHELRNPLASINFNVQLLEKALEKDQNTRAIFQDTNEAIERIKILVKRVLDFTKKGLPAFKSGCIHHSINDAAELIAPQLGKKHIEIKRDFSRDVGPITFDPNQMQQVFVNLLMNATEATPDGGTIDIRSDVEKRRQHSSDMLVLTISDNGQGILPDHLPKVFDPFFTTKADGTGLGLSIVHKILEQHDATIDVKSKENKGTTFIIRIPIKKIAERDVSVQDINCR